MDRNQKGAEVVALKERFAKVQLAILADYQGLKVNDINQLRLRLREKGACLKVVKNRIAKIALKGTAFEAFAEHFEGTSAIATTETDPSGPAKVLVDFVKEFETVQIKAASMAGKTLSKQDIVALANLPSKEELLAKLMGSMMAPARNWVSVLAQIPRQLVNVLAAVRDQKEKAN